MGLSYGVIIVGKVLEVVLEDRLEVGFGWGGRKSIVEGGGVVVWREF